MKPTFRRSSLLLTCATTMLAFNATAGAAVISFATPPFAGTNALTEPGRQVVGGELFTSFLVGSDVFSFDPAAFGISSLTFANDVAGALPTSGANVIVLRTFDDDANPATPFGAGNAANLIAAQVTALTPGFFLYFNSGLNVPRLVYSTDLNVNTSDLKILARLTNLTGDAGRDAFPAFTSANFQVAVAPVPEPASNLILVLAAGALFVARWTVGLARRRGWAT